MRSLALLIALAAFPAFGYDVTATMPATTGATSCQLYLDGAPAGTPKPCGAAQSYPGLIANPGTYAFAYKAINASGETSLSPTTNVSIDVIPPPVDPTDPPVISVACTDSGGAVVTCPPNIVITIAP
jgi:hypothetical protein